MPSAWRPQRKWGLARNGSTRSLQGHRNHDVGLLDRAAMILTETKNPDVFVIELERRRDEWGFLATQWCADEFARVAPRPENCLDQHRSQRGGGHIAECILS